MATNPEVSYAFCEESAVHHLINTSISDSADLFELVDACTAYVSVLVDTFGTGVVSDNELEAAVEKVFDLRPTAIIRDLDLRKPIYRQLAAYGHMGREDLGVSWEKTDRVEALKAALGK